MVAEPDFQLAGEAVIDEKQLEQQVDEITFEMQGESSAVEDAQGQNEERNDQLGVISRGIISILRFITKIGLILSAALVILQKLGDIFDISFEDVRTAIVQAINSVIETIKDMLPGGRGTPVPQTPTEFALEGFSAGIPSIPQGLLTGSLRRLDAPGTSDQNVNVNVLTSRDQMTGDSTQKDQENNGLIDNIFNWGE